MRAEFFAAIRRIPKGKVASYGDVARGAGYEGAARQVAWALHGSRGLPWHRVVGSGGEIKLSGEAAMEQRMRLESEGVTFHGKRVNMALHRYRFPAPRRRPARRTGS